MSDGSEFGETYAVAQIKRRRSGGRAWVRQFYLDRILRQVDGPTVDIGCGAGQLLERLPAGSVGLEVNPVLVDDLRARGLHVHRVKAEGDRISLGPLKRDEVQCAVLSHVLEHFDDAASVLLKLIADCRAIGIGRLIVVVPGAVGFRSDATHKTFVTMDYLRSHGLLDGDGFSLRDHGYFPGNHVLVGHLFVYHELMVVYKLVPLD